MTTINLNAQENADARKITITNALIWTLFNIIIFLITYYAAPSLLSNATYGILSFAISIGLAIYFIKDIRAKIGGYWSFRTALKYIFLLFFVQMALTMVFSIVFGKWIEPSYTEVRLEEARNQAVERAEQMTSDQDKVDEMIAQSEKWSKMLIDPDLKSFTVLLAISAIFYFIGALIFAAIFKRNPPIFAPIEEE